MAIATICYIIYPKTQSGEQLSKYESGPIYTRMTIGRTKILFSNRPSNYDLDIKYSFHCHFSYGLSSSRIFITFRGDFSGEKFNSRWEDLVTAGWSRVCDYNIIVVARPHRGLNRYYERKIDYIYNFLSTRCFIKFNATRFTRDKFIWDHIRIFKHGHRLTIIDIHCCNRLHKPNCIQYKH